MKKLIALLAVIGIGCCVSISAQASSGGIPTDIFNKKEAPKTVPAKKTPVKSAPEKSAQPGTVSPAEAQTPIPGAVQKSPEDLRREKALVAKKRSLLDNTEWSINMVPLSGKGKGDEDVVVFSQGKVSTKGLIDSGFVPTNYSLNIKEDGKLVWETMQTKGEEIVFFKGEVTPELDKMSGVVSFQQLEGPKNYSFSSSGKKEINLE